MKLKASARTRKKADQGPWPALLALILASTASSGAQAATVYVSKTGADSSSCGSAASPCGSVEHAVEQRAQQGDLVSIQDGTYAMGQLAVPAGVSISSAAQDQSKVTLKPSVNLGKSTPWIMLDNASPGGSGNQSISHLSFYGINGSVRVTFALRVRNRNGVRVHHCSFTDFREPVFDPDERGAATVEVKSTVMGWVKTSLYWPDDPGPPGDDRQHRGLVAR